MQIEAIGKEFDCRIYNFKPLRAVYIAETDKGPMIVKEASREPDKILYIHGLKEYLYQKDFHNLDRFLLSNKGLPFIIQDNRVFIMERFIKGRECCFTNPFDTENAVKALAMLHKCGKGYMPTTGALKRDNIGKWEKSQLKKINYLVEVKEKIRGIKRKKLFDRLYLKDIDFMLHMAWRSYDTLKTSNYKNACKEAKEQNTICHHDYTYHNIIIDKDSVNVIDFDYCCHELPIYDLASFVFKVVKRFFFDIDMAMSIIENYNKIIPVSKDELKMMLSIFEFPQRFWRLSERYYQKKTDWNNKRFIHKYEDVELTRKYILDFTNKFSKYI